MKRKPRILFFQFDLMSHFFRSLRVATALKNNYDIYIQKSEKYQSWIEKASLKSFSCLDINPKKALEAIENFDFTWLSFQALEMTFKDQVRVIKKYNPDIVVGDTSFSLKMATESTNKPYISILNGYSTKYFALARKLSPKHPVAPFISWLPKIILDRLVRIGEEGNFFKIKKEFQKVRTKYNLNTSTHYLDELSGDLNLICDLPELFPQRNLPNSYCFVGPLFHEIYDYQQDLVLNIPKGKKVILVTLGSSGDWSRVEFLNGNEFSNYHIITIGDEKNILGGKRISKYNFVNFNEILPAVDLLICHGGNGTIYQALAHKIPIICCPVHLEQGWNTHRIQELGFGQSIEMVKPKLYSNIIEKWIKARHGINWYLNFETFNSNCQNKTLKEKFAEVLKHNKISEFA